MHLLHRVIALVLSLSLLQGNLAGADRACTMVQVATSATHATTHGASHEMPPSEHDPAHCAGTSHDVCALPGVIGACTGAVGSALLAVRFTEDASPSARSPIAVARELDSPSRPGPAPDVPPPRA